MGSTVDMRPLGARRAVAVVVERRDRETVGETRRQVDLRIVGLSADHGRRAAPVVAVSIPVSRSIRPD
jgi:hypothetical protein